MEASADFVRWSNEVLYSPLKNDDFRSLRWNCQFNQSWTKRVTKMVFKKNIHGACRNDGFSRANVIPQFGPSIFQDHMNITKVTWRRIDYHWFWYPLVMKRIYWNSEFPIKNCHFHSYGYVSLPYQRVSVNIWVLEFPHAMTSADLFGSFAQLWQMNLLCLPWPQQLSRHGLLNQFLQFGMFYHLSVVSKTSGKAACKPREYILPHHI